MKFTAKSMVIVSPLGDYGNKKIGENIYTICYGEFDNKFLWG